MTYIFVPAYKKLHAQLPVGQWLTPEAVWKLATPRRVSIAWNMHGYMTHLLKKNLVERRKKADGFWEYCKLEVVT